MSLTVPEINPSFHWKTIVLKGVNFQTDSYVIFHASSSQDNSYLYMVMNYVSGGEMFSYLRHHGRFRYFEEQSVAP